MLERFRQGWQKVMRPLASGLLTMQRQMCIRDRIGTIGAVVMALVCLPQGWLWQGALLITLFIFSDSLDGNMARQLGRTSQWGSFLDSTLDRFGDGAVFAGIALYYAGPGHSTLWCGVALAALILSLVTSYVRAKAESLSMDAKMGIATRADRLLISLVAVEITGLARVGVLAHWFCWALPVGLCYLTVAGAITVGQRMTAVKRQSES